MYAFDARSRARAWVLWSNDGQGGASVDGIESEGAGYAIFDGRGRAAGGVALGQWGRGGRW